MPTTKKILIISIFFSILTCNAINIIFDLSGVLLSLKKFEIACDIGLRNCLSAGNSGKARIALLEFLDAIEPRRPETPPSCDENGVIMPQIMCDWLTGKKTPLQIRTLTHENIDLCPKRYQKFITALTEVMFTPERFYKHHKLSKARVNFVLQCIEQGHDVYILSNWDAQTFALLQQKHREFFSLFKGIMISGTTGLLKPDPAMYKELLTTYNLDPKKCIFIDDQETNLIEAQACGINCVHCPAKGRKPDFEHVEKQVTAILKNLKS